MFTLTVILVSWSQLTLVTNLFHFFIMSCCSTENQSTSCKVKASILTIVLFLIAISLVNNLKKDVNQAQLSIVDIESEGRLEVKARTDQEVVDSFKVVAEGAKAQVPPSILFNQQVKQNLAKPNPKPVVAEAQKTTAAKLREAEEAKQNTSNPFSL